MYIICFYWQGDRWNNSREGLKQKSAVRLGQIDNDLASIYINNLYEGVKKYANQDFKFICFTNEDIRIKNAGVEIRNFPILGDGVLPRMYMFSRESGLFGAQVLCIDLDVVVTGSLKKIMDYRGAFCTRSRFNIGERHKLDGDIMSFYAGIENEEKFWVPVKNNIQYVNAISNGRERFWVSHVTNDIGDRWDTVVPEKIVSYKMHVKRNPGILKKSSLVSFHGYPRPHQCNDTWLRQYWKL